MTTTPRIACEPAATVAEIAQDDTEFRSELRRSMRNVRTALTADVRAEHDSAIAANIERWLRAQSLSSLGVYWPILGEPDFHKLYAKLAGMGIGLALPNVIGRDQPLQFLAWTPGDALRFDRLGIAIPEKNRIIEPQALLIPCVAFNAKNFRLGYGGGYYDRTLATIPWVIPVGVAYSVNKADFTGAAHDIPMQMIITEIQEDFTVKRAKPESDAAR